MGKIYARVENGKLVINLSEAIPYTWTRAKSTNCIETLEDYLADAIEKEDYEEAAELRDAIQKLTPPL